MYDDVNKYYIVYRGYKKKKPYIKSISSINPIVEVEVINAKHKGKFSIVEAFISIEEAYACIDMLVDLKNLK